MTNTPKQGGRSATAQKMLARQVKTGGQMQPDELEACLRILGFEYTLDGRINTSGFAAHVSEHQEKTLRYDQVANWLAGTRKVSGPLALYLRTAVAHALEGKASQRAKAA